MSEINKLKIFNDPIYGFITIPNSIIYDLIEHPYFQRLRRITQMGVSYLVYLGSNHTRFHHALGCLHIMQKAISVLRYKSVSISEEEENALYIAILLHDIGHGPFSHAMEKSIVADVNHEQISLQFMHQLNLEFDGKLNLAIKIFTGEYHRKFMLQLISSQLDMDRMDYLKRDSFYSGVSEGNINSERLIQMMNVVDDVLVVEEKGIYSIEKFIMSRRLMYWQVYLHKTSIAAELVLTTALKRAKELINHGTKLPCSEILLFFMKNKITLQDFTKKNLDLFSLLDDFDIVSALKSWQTNDDFILSSLSKSLINRDLPMIKLKDNEISSDEIEDLKKQLSIQKNISMQETSYFIFEGEIEIKTYDKNAEPIRILQKDKTIKNISDVSNLLKIDSLSMPEKKYYTCFPKQLAIK